MNKVIDLRVEREIEEQDADDDEYGNRMRFVEELDAHVVHDAFVDHLEVETFAFLFRASSAHSERRKRRGGNETSEIDREQGSVMGGKLAGVGLSFFGACHAFCFSKIFQHSY
jgi:hypothetical protein